MFEADEAKKRILDLSAKAEKLEVPRGSQGNLCKKTLKTMQKCGNSYSYELPVATLW